MHPPPPAPLPLAPRAGKGAFGTVHLAVHRRTGAQHACKSISKARLLSPADVDAVRHEVEILHLLTPHPTVAGLVGVYEDRAAVHIVEEYCAGGELFDRIVARKSLSEAEAARSFRCMVDMVRHCHACGVMHRDIKPENFLLTDSSDDAAVCACDFGLGAFFKPGQPLSALVGSAYYVAPEVLRRSYGPKADLWSLGVVLYILLSGEARRAHCAALPLGGGRRGAGGGGRGAVWWGYQPADGGDACLPPAGSPPFWGATDKDTFAAILRGAPSFAAHPWPGVSAAAKGAPRFVFFLRFVLRQVAVLLARWYLH